MKRTTSVRPVREPDEDGELALELTCALHPDEGLRVFIDPSDKRVDMCCRACGEVVASSAGVMADLDDEIPPPPDGRVH